MSLTLSSMLFQHGGMMPVRHTCDGAALSPQFVDAPDPQAPKMTWVHWLLYNIPPQAHELPEGVAATNLPAGTLPGTNDGRRTGYGGPCPPIGRHRYFHKLFALDVRLPDLKNPGKH